MSGQVAGHSTARVQCKAQLHCLSGGRTELCSIKLQDLEREREEVCQASMEKQHCLEQVHWTILFPSWSTAVMDD